MQMDKKANNRSMFVLTWATPGPALPGVAPAARPGAHPALQTERGIKLYVMSFDSVQIIRNDMPVTCLILLMR